eukprot:15459443-Alexandrium_andersonii.AAC.1
MHVARTQDNESEALRAKDGGQGVSAKAKPTVMWGTRVDHKQDKRLNTRESPCDLNTHFQHLNNKHPIGLNAQDSVKTLCVGSDSSMGSTR